MTTYYIKYILLQYTSILTNSGFRHVIVIVLEESDSLTYFNSKNQIGSKLFIRYIDHMEFKLCIFFFFPPPSRP